MNSSLEINTVIKRVDYSRMIQSTQIYILLVLVYINN